MTRRENISSAQDKAMNAAQVVFSLNPRYFAPYAQNFMQTPDNFLEEIEKFTSAWMQRRQEATQSMLEVSKSLFSDGITDPTSAMKGLTEWQAQSLERFAKDAEDCTKMVSHCVNTLYKSEIDAIDQAVKDTTKAVKTSKASPV